MANLAELTVQITAQSSQFSAAISGIEARMATFESQTLGHLNKVEAGVNKLGTASKGHFAQMEESLAKVGGAFRNIMQVATGVSLANLFPAAIQQAESLVTQGVTYNATLEEGKIAIAALLQGTTSLTTADGEKLSASASWNVNLREAASLQEQIAIMSAKSPGTQQELSEAFRTTLAYARGQKATTQELLEFAQGMLNVGKLQGITGEKLNTEIRQSLQLQSAQGQVILPILGISMQQGRVYRDHGMQITEMLKKLEGYKLLADATALTWEGLTSSAATFMNLLQAHATEGVFGASKAFLSGFGTETLRLQGEGGMNTELQQTTETFVRLGTIAADVYGAMVRDSAVAAASALDLTASIVRLIEELAGSNLSAPFQDIGKVIGLAIWGWEKFLALLGEPTMNILASAAAGFVFFEEATKALAQAANPFSENFLNLQEGLDRARLHAIQTGDEVKLALMQFGQVPAEQEKRRLVFGANLKIMPDADYWRELGKAPFLPGFPLLTRTPNPSPEDKAGDKAKKAHDNAVKSLQEQVAAATAQNASLAESITLNRSLADSEALASAAKKGHRADTDSLTSALAKQNDLLKVQKEFLQERERIQTALSESDAILPRQLALIAQATQDHTPMKELQNQLKDLTEDAHWQTLEGHFANKIAPTEVARVGGERLTLRANTQLKDDALAHAQTLSGLETAQANTLEQEQMRNTILREGIAVGASYAATQRDITQALEILKLEEDARKEGKAGLTPDEIEQAKGRLQQIQDIQDQNAALENQSKLAGEISQDITSAFFDMSKNIGNAFEGMRNLVLKIVEDISKNILKQQVTDPLSAWINKFLSQIPGLGVQDKEIRANTVYVNGNLVGPGGQGGIPGAPVGRGIINVGANYGIDNSGSLPGIVGGGSIDKQAQEALGAGKINANDVIWKLAGAAGGAGAAGAAGNSSSILSWLSSGASSLWSGLSSSFGSLGGLFSGVSGGIGSLFGGIGSLFGFHSGGIVPSTSMLEPSLFTEAPSFHNGLMPGEVPAILMKGEGVFTPEQMRHMGNSTTIIQNIQTPDLGSFNRSAHQLAVDQRAHQEVSNRRFA